jgi:chromosome segregation ATPase
MKTLRIQTEIKLEQTKYNLLKERILNKTEAINRTLQQKANEQSATEHQHTIAQLKTSIERAENTLEGLQEELEEASYDDRTAFYQELEEELRVTYLEYERLQVSLSESKEQANSLERELKRVDEIASKSHLTELREHIERVKSVNKGLRAKWYAYQKKMHNMSLETRIKENREDQRRCNETIREGEDEYEASISRLKKLTDVLQSQNEDYDQKIEELFGIIDGQRRRIVQYLMGQGMSRRSNQGEEEEQGETEREGEGEVEEQE